MNRDYLILDQQVAGLLMLMRNRLVTARPDKNDKTKNVFFFENTEKFKNDFSFIKDNKNYIEELIINLKGN